MVEIIHFKYEWDSSKVLKRDMKSEREKFDDALRWNEMENLHVWRAFLNVLNFKIKLF